MCVLMFWRDIPFMSARSKELRSAMSKTTPPSADARRHSSIAPLEGPRMTVWITFRSSASDNERSMRLPACVLVL